ncbi:HAD-IIIC family phosphatase [bacterium]|nr:HAD-IIIC family phosphatase [bacterium]
MSELSNILELVRADDREPGAVERACFRLDEKFQCSSNEVTKLWNLARRDGLAGLDLEPCSVAVLSNSTQDFFLPFLYAAGFACGLDLKITWPGFDLIGQMAADPASEFYAAEPDVVFLNYNLEGKLGQVYHTTLTREERAEAAEELLKEISFVVANISKQRPQAKIVIHGFYWYEPPVLGYLDDIADEGPGDVSAWLNDRLRELARQYPGSVYLLDMARVVGRVGFSRWRDNNRWFGERVETVQGNPVLAREYLKFIKSFTKRNRKVIVLDLDNTLWGGLAGEEGLAGVQLGSSYPGNAYRQFQQILKLYSQRGVLLAINSKNNPGDAMAIINEHPEMVLREDDFVAIRINWENKAANMKAIADELNLGLNSLIFIDDSPQERNLVRHAIPEVLVPEFPAQTADLPYVLDSLNDLDYNSFTDTDRARTSMYKTEGKRLELKGEATDLEAYLAMLETSVTLSAAGEADLERLEQMFQRTNQFNVTTKRYTLAELSQFAQSGDHALVRASAKDKFGEFGIIAAALLAFGEKAAIDSFLMSCRVIGRGIESAVLSHLARLAAERGFGELFGTFVPTAKNAPSRDVYSRHGFESCESPDDEGEGFVLRELSNDAIIVPSYLNVKQPGND